MAAALLPLLHDDFSSSAGFVPLRTCNTDLAAQTNGGAVNQQKSAMKREAQIRQTRCRVFRASAREAGALMPPLVDSSSDSDVAPAWPDSDSDSDSDVPPDLRPILRLYLHYNTHFLLDRNRNGNE